MLRIIKRVIARCVVASQLWLLRRNCFGRGLFNMIRWVICVIGIAVDNLVVVVLGRSKENRGSSVEFSLDY